MARKPERELFLKRVRKIVLLLKIGSSRWKELAELKELPVIKSELKELINQEFLVADKKFSRFTLTRKGGKVAKSFSPAKRKMQAIFYSNLPKRKGVN